MVRILHESIPHRSESCNLCCTCVGTKTPWGSCIGVNSLLSLPSFTLSLSASSPSPPSLSLTVNSRIIYTWARARARAVVILMYFIIEVMSFVSSSDCSKWPSSPPSPGDLRLVRKLTIYQESTTIRRNFILWLLY